MQAQIDEIREHQKEHTKMLLQQSQTLNRIETAFFGDDQAGIDGLVKKVSNHEKYIGKDKKIKWTAAGMLALLAMFKDKLVNILFH